MVLDFCGPPTHKQNTLYDQQLCFTRHTFTNSIIRILRMSLMVIIIICSTRPDPGMAEWLAGCLSVFITFKCTRANFSRLFVDCKTCLIVKLFFFSSAHTHTHSHGTKDTLAGAAEGEGERVNEHSFIHGHSTYTTNSK